MPFNWPCLASFVFPLSTPHEYRAVEACGGFLSLPFCMGVVDDHDYLLSDGLSYPRRPCSPWAAQRGV